MTWIARLASQAPVPVFVAQGKDAPAETAQLCLDPALRIVDTPRAAAILIVAGTIPEALTPHLHRLHDQLPHPRASVLWQSAQPDLLPAAIIVTNTIDIVAELTETYTALLSGAHETEPDIQPNKPPNEWRGIGPHGQGGKGMMGGTPYGRPMAMTAEDMRDGLTLDAYTADFGPFLPMFPPGLILTLTLQGDVIQKVAVVHPPFSSDWSGGAALLRLIGLPALAERLLRGKAQADAKLARLIRLSGARLAIPAGLGRTRDGSDVRDRMDRMIGDSAVSMTSHVGDTTLGDLLVGCEWHEAMLVLNSFNSGSLRKLCSNAPSADDHSVDDTKGHDPHDPHAGHMT